MTGSQQPTWVPNFARLATTAVELLPFLNHDRRTDGRTDRHYIINNIDKNRISSDNQWRRF